MRRPAKIADQTTTHFLFVPDANRSKQTVYVNACWRCPNHNRQNVPRWTGCIGQTSCSSSTHAQARDRVGRPSPRQDYSPVRSIYMLRRANPGTSTCMIGVCCLRSTHPHLEVLKICTIAYSVLRCPNTERTCTYTRCRDRDPRKQSTLFSRGPRHRRARYAAPALVVGIAPTMACE
jgi:hypothetical protein